MSDDPNDFDPLFHASCRTVSSVSSQIADLKKAADEMATDASSLKREYLTPTEDEAAQAVGRFKSAPYNAAFRPQQVRSPGGVAQSDQCGAYGNSPRLAPCGSQGDSPIGEPTSASG